MSDKEFSEKIQESLEQAKSDLKTVRSRIKNPKYHENRVGKALKEAVTELRGLDPETNMIQELLGILDQVPAFVGSAWIENETMATQLEGRISTWQDVGTQLSEHMSEIEEKKRQEAEAIQRKKDLAQQVAAGEISEPTKMTSIRRKPGTRPESLSNIRKAQETLKQLGNQVPKDSEG